MSLSLVLGPAAGLASVFLALSLIATWVQELIAAALKLRSRTLAVTIREALDVEGVRGDPRREIEAAWTAEAGASVRLRLQESLFKALYRHPLIWVQRAARDLPVHIPTRELAGALLDLLARAGGEESPAAAAIDRIKIGIRSVGNRRARTVLASMVRGVEAGERSAELQVAALREAAATWFDAVMERASGWYRRRAHAVAFALGAALGLAFNVDAVRIARALWDDALLAEAVRVEVERGGAGAIDRLAQIGLPIGWGQAFPSDGGAIALWLLGILLTAVAVAQGSPLWFDVLKRFANVRLSGRGLESQDDGK